MIRTAALALCCIACATLAQAQDRRLGRYAFVPAKEGTLRLDTATGEVAVCAGGADDVQCRPMRNTLPVGRADIAEIKARLSAVERRLAGLERTQGGSAARAEPAPVLHRVGMLADRAMRQLFGLVREMKREPQT